MSELVGHDHVPDRDDFVQPWDGFQGENHSLLTKANEEEKVAAEEQAIETILKVTVPELARLTK